MTTRAQGRRVTTSGAWCCDWPDCDRLAVSQLRTTLLGWMKVCRQHRQAWQSVPYGRLAEIYRDLPPSRMEATGTHWLADHDDWYR